MLHSAARKHFESNQNKSCKCNHNSHTEAQEERSIRYVAAAADVDRPNEERDGKDQEGGVLVSE